MTLSHDQLATLWIVAGGDPGTQDTAAAIAQAESGGCQYALAGPVDIRPVKQCTWRVTSRENSCGLWQINLYAHPDYEAPSIFDLARNAEAAVAISDGGVSFSAWSTYTSGAYRAYLQAGGTPTPTPGLRLTDTTASLEPTGHHGWADLRNSVNKHLPTQLQRSQMMRRDALRTLGVRSKVG